MILEYGHLLTQVWLEETKNLKCDAYENTTWNQQQTSELH